MLKNLPMGEPYTLVILDVELLLLNNNPPRYDDFIIHQLAMLAAEDPNIRIVLPDNKAIDERLIGYLNKMGIPVATYVNKATSKEKAFEQLYSELETNGQIPEKCIYFSNDTTSLYNITKWNIGKTERSYDEQGEDMFVRRFGETKAKYQKEELRAREDQEKELRDSEEREMSSEEKGVVLNLLQEKRPKSEELKQSPLQPPLPLPRSPITPENFEETLPSQRTEKINLTTVFLDSSNIKKSRLDMLKQISTLIDNAIDKSIEEVDVFKFRKKQGERELIDNTFDLSLFTVSGEREPRIKITYKDSGGHTISKIVREDDINKIGVNLVDKIKNAIQNDTLDNISMDDKTKFLNSTLGNHEMSLMKSSAKDLAKKQKKESLTKQFDIMKRDIENLEKLEKHGTVLTQTQTDGDISDQYKAAHRLLESSTPKNIFSRALASKKGAVNISSAVESLKALANQGVAAAMMDLARMANDGAPGVPKDPQGAYYLAALAYLHAEKPEERDCFNFYSGKIPRQFIRSFSNSSQPIGSNQNWWSNTKNTV